MNEIEKEEIRQELERLRQRYEELQEEVREIQKRPEIQEKHKLFKNWNAHVNLGVAKNTFCPVCGSSWRSLRWACHDIDVEEARRIAKEKYVKAIKGGMKNGNKRC